ncbi:MAG: hypothetical protein B6I24_01120 [Bacteroidetes bacterium 4572_128]|nr:MAG: hypothetical protein B6I24_01120 [Bacteroidetes bacterium 4572_128]
MHFTKNATTLKSKLYGFCFLRKNFFYHTIMSGYDFYKKQHWRLKKNLQCLKNFFHNLPKILIFFNFKIKKIFFKNRPKFYNF